MKGRRSSPTGLNPCRCRLPSRRYFAMIPDAPWWWKARPSESFFRRHRHDLSRHHPFHRGHRLLLMASVHARRLRAALLRGPHHRRLGVSHGRGLGGRDPDRRGRGRADARPRPAPARDCSPTLGSAADRARLCRARRPRRLPRHARHREAHHAVGNLAVGVFRHRCGRGRRHRVRACYGHGGRWPGRPEPDNSAAGIGGTIGATPHRPRRLDGVAMRATEPGSR